MSRKSIYDILENKVLDPTIAFSRLKYQLINTPCKCRIGYSISLKKFIDDHIFDNLAIRGSSINLDDLIINELGIQLYNEKHKTFDELFQFCELIFYIVDSIPGKEVYLYCDATSRMFIFDRILFAINSILESTNHITAKNRLGHRIIIAKDAKLNLATELVNKNISLELLEYNHYSNKGNLTEKKKILDILGGYIEPSLKARKTELSKDIGFLLNNFNIRHNNKTGSNKKDYIVKMEDIELEKWYDKTYGAIVAFIIENSTKSLHEELEQFK